MLSQQHGQCEIKIFTFFASNMHNKLEMHGATWNDSSKVNKKKMVNTHGQNRHFFRHTFDIPAHIHTIGMKLSPIHEYSATRTHTHVEQSGARVVVNSNVEIMFGMKVCEVYRFLLQIKCVQKNYLLASTKKFWFTSANLSRSWFCECKEKWKQKNFHET